MKPKRSKRADTYALSGGGFLHVDKFIMPIIRADTARSNSPDAPRTRKGG